MRGFLVFLIIPSIFTLFLCILLFHGNCYTLYDKFKLFCSIVLISFPFYISDTREFWDRCYIKIYSKFSKIFLEKMTIDLNPVFKKSDEEKPFELIHHFKAPSISKETSIVTNPTPKLETLINPVKINQSDVPKSDDNLITEESNIELSLKQPEKKFRNPSSNKSELRSNPETTRNEESNDIGDLGEKLAFNYEKNRLRKIDINLVNKLEFLGNKRGLGYDIKSIDNGKEVFIEVKSSTGDFYSPIIFTKTEYNKMLNCENTFYLYRIYNLNIKTGKADIFILKGLSEIDKYFDIITKSYTVKLKSNIN